LVDSADDLYCGRFQEKRGSPVVEDWIPAEIEERRAPVEGIRACLGSIHGLVLVSYLSHSADLFTEPPRVVCYVIVAVDLLAFPLPLPLSPHPYPHLFFYPHSFLLLSRFRYRVCVPCTVP